jgi:SNF2 family DNA or RNA helicase
LFDLLNHIFAEANPYLGETKKLPDLPHLVVVPGTLLSQWDSELRVLLKPKSFDILMYGTGKALHDKFWAPDGPFHMSKHPARQKIIVASHSVRI